MNSLKYQLRSIRRDKLCILTFLLPVVAGIAINLLFGVSFQSISETSFGVIQSEATDDTVAWLQQNGIVTEYETLDALRSAVNDPSTQMIGVIQVDDTIQTFISGDELEVNRVIADTLPQIYENQREPLPVEQTLIHVETGNEGLKSLLIAITLVTAMFMGCTFNAMNIISEKEDGIKFINQVLPMTTRSYVVQKILLGFVGGTASTIVTASICMRIELAQVLPFLLIILLSSYISALSGLFIGTFSNGLMIGIVYIKIIMILFLAPPIFFYLIVPDNAIVFWLSYILPSSATFYGIMDLFNRQSAKLWPALIALLLHAVLWSIVYKLVQMRSDEV
ncbi:ABC transporter permease [Lachnospiraceae bacterium 42-17]